jgi:hypothetical protein
MEHFNEQWTYFTRSLTILGAGAPLSAVLLCLAGRHIAHSSEAEFEFSDALLFSAAGGLLGPPLIAGIALALGALGPDATTLVDASTHLINIAVLGLVIGTVLGVPLGFLAAWDTLRRAKTPPHQFNRRQN